MVSSVHRNSFQLAIPGRDKIPAYTSFFFFDLQCPKISKQDYLGTGRPNREARNSPALWMSSQSPFKDVQTFPKARGIPVTRPSQSPWGLQITENAGQ